MNKGWIKLHRNLFDNKFYLLETFTKSQAWIDLLLLANCQDGAINVRGNIVNVKRGQVGWSEESLAKRWGWSRNKVRRFFLALKTAQQIEQQKNPFLTLVSIVNYSKWQSNDTTNETTGDTTDDTTDGHKQEEKKKEKKKEREPKLSKRGQLLAFGEEGTIKLSRDEELKLYRSIGRRNTNKYIQAVENWKLARGKSYKDDYRGILGWIKNDKDSGKLRINWEDFMEEDFESKTEYEKIINKHQI